VKGRIVRTTVAVAAIAVLLLAVPLAIVVAALYRDETAQVLLGDAARAAAAVPAPPLEPGDPVEFPAASSGAVIGVYAPDGARIAGAGPARADGLTLDALQGRPTTAARNGEISVALPVGAQERVVGAVRASLPQEAVDARVHGTWFVMVGIGAAAIMVAAMLALWQARRLSRPLEALARSAAQLGEGDFSATTSPSSVKEIDTVAEVMRETSQRLAGVLERERAFSADASHQLKTPLTAMRIRLEGALATPQADHDAEIRGAVEAIDRLEHSVDELLRLARDDPGDRRALDLPMLIEQWCAPWRSRLNGSGRQVDLSIPRDLPTIVVSESALHQILAVLVDNAITHGAGTVSLSARAMPGGVTIDVGDQGAGVDDAQHIFERRSSGGAGTGIGLALARSLAEAERGRLTLLARGPHPLFRIAFATALR
jgi:signal transduction histidine kinase